MLAIVRGALGRLCSLTCAASEVQGRELLGEIERPCRIAGPEHETLCSGCNSV